MSNSNSFAKSIGVDFSASNDTVSTVDASHYSSDTAKNDSKSGLQAQLDRIRSNPSENTQSEPETEDYSLWEPSEHDPIHPKHRKEWMEGSGISKEITEACLESLDDNEEIAHRLGWADGYNKSQGWWVNSIDIITGERTSCGQFKPDMSFPIGKSTKPAKYISAKAPVDVIALPIRSKKEWEAIIDDPSEAIVIVEGAKKAAAVETCGHTALAVGGVWNFLQEDGTLAPNLRAIAQKGRPIRLAYDADMVTNPKVRKAMMELGHRLKAKGCKVHVLQWDIELGKGLDDVLVAHGKAQIDELMGNFISFRKWLKSQNTQDQNSSKKSKGNQETPQSSHKQKLEQFYATFEGKLRYNEMTLDYEYDGQVIDLEHAQDWLADVLDVGFPYKFEELVRKIKYCAKKQSYHPVKEYLERISVKYHDIDTTILDNLATKYFGTEDPLHNIQLKKSLVGAVKRIIDPGCQHDTVCVLQGKQGLQKSKFWETLAISTGWYNSSVASGSSDKDDKMKLRASWLIDLSELEGIFKSKETASLRNLITDKVDSIRPPYGRKIEHFQRMSVFVGTVNPSQFLTDSEGTRRWWIIPVTKQIPIEHLEAERDLIWAAAYKISLRGEKYNSWLSPVEDAGREKSNQNHQVEDIWFEHVQKSILMLNTKQTTVSNILSGQPFNLSVDRQGKREQMRISDVLKQLGWSKSTNKVMLDGYRTYVWSRPELHEEVLGVSQGVSQGVSHPSNLDTASNTAISDLPDLPFKETSVENNNVVCVDPYAAKSEQVIEKGESGKSGESLISETITQQASHNDLPVTNLCDSPLEDQTLEVGNSSVSVLGILEDLINKPVTPIEPPNLPREEFKVEPSPIEPLTEPDDGYIYQQPKKGDVALMFTRSYPICQLRGKVLEVLECGDVTIQWFEAIGTDARTRLRIITLNPQRLAEGKATFTSPIPSIDAEQKSLEQYLEPYKYTPPTAGDSVVMLCGAFEYSGQVLDPKNSSEQVDIKWLSTTDPDKSRLGLDAYSIKELTEGKAVFSKPEPESAFNPIAVPEVAKVPTVTESTEPSLVEIEEDLFESVLSGDDDDYLATFSAT